MWFIYSFFIGVFASICCLSFEYPSIPADIKNGKIFILKTSRILLTKTNTRE